MVGKGIEEENPLERGCRLVNMKASFVTAWVSDSLSDAVVSRLLQYRIVPPVLPYKINIIFTLFIFL